MLIDVQLLLILGAPRIGQPGPPPPGYRGPSRGNASGAGSQNQSASALLRMGVPPPRGGPPIPLGSSPNSASPMGMVGTLDNYCPFLYLMYSIKH